MPYRLGMCQTIQSVIFKVKIKETIYFEGDVGELSLISKLSP